MLIGISVWIVFAILSCGIWTGTMSQTFGETLGYRKVFLEELKRVSIISILGGPVSFICIFITFFSYDHKVKLSFSLIPPKA